MVSIDLDRAQAATYIRIGRPPRLTARARLGWVGRVARSMLRVCGVGVALLVVLMMAVDVLTQ